MQKAPPDRDVPAPLHGPAVVLTLAAAALLPAAVAFVAKVLLFGVAAR